MSSPTVERAAAVDAVAEAGAAVASESFRTALDVERKASAVDPVTEADRRAQRRVVDAVEARFPDDVVVGEEGDAAKAVPEEGYAWVVDPIDGTLNYTRGVGAWVTSVAAVADGRPFAAANLAPALGDSYRATESGTARNGTAVGVSDESDPGAFVVASTFTVGTGRHAAFGTLADVVLDRFGEFRRLGSAQLTLSLLASGGVDAVVGLTVPAPWDSLAGVFQVRQAGGVVTDVDGRAWRGDAPVVASNGHAHDAVCEAVRRALGGDDG